MMFGLTMFSNSKTMSLFYNYLEHKLQKQHTIALPVYTSTGPTNPKSFTFYVEYN
uniref:Uncharacterized protein n=1 Tax=Arundo donax TaxID=35708 RepID=A0A0A9EC82_ARUDO